jgi:hypothetical protein
MAGCVPVLVGEVVRVGWGFLQCGEICMLRIWTSREGAYWFTATWGRVHVVMQFVPCQ